MKKLIQDVKQMQKCNNMADRWDTYFTEPLAMLCSRVFVKWGVHPNLVTTFSIITGVAGGVCFFFGGLPLNLLGFFLEIVAAVFDCSDGQVARMSHKKSEFGRILDGFGDGLVCLAVYVGACRQLMEANVSFTNVPWGIWVWVVCLLCGGYFHADQARVADYYRNVHVYLTRPNSGSELTRSRKIAEERKAAPKGSFKKVVLFMYGLYTKSQELYAPNLQKLLDAVEAAGGVSEDVSARFAETSDKIVRRTNLLTYNLRAYSFYFFILIGHADLIFPVILLVIEPIKWFLILRYEKAAKTVLDECFTRSAAESVL